MSACTACGFIRDRVGGFALYLRYAFWALWSPDDAALSMAERSARVRR